MATTDGRWDYYEASPGSENVLKEIRKSRLTTRELASLQVLLDRVASNTALPNDTATIRGDIYEVRFSANKRIFRLLYADVGSGPLLLALHFFQKKTQKTPKPVIELATKRLKDWRERNT